MSEHSDAFGQMIYDFHIGDPAVEIIERDDGFISTGSGPAVYFKTYESWAAHEQEAIALARGRVLDVGCGAGRHALHLQGQGLDVVGIDLSPKAIEVCRQRGLRQCHVCAVTRLGSQFGKFDTLLMMGNNFGLFGGEARARWLLRRFKNITTPGARIIAASNDPHQTTRPVHLAYHRRNLRRERLAGQLRLRVRYLDMKGEWFDYLLASKEEMRQIVEGTGWKVEQTFDSGSSMYVAVLEKAH